MVFCEPLWRTICSSENNQTCSIYLLSLDWSFNQASTEPSDIRTSWVCLVYLSSIISLNLIIYLVIEIIFADSKTRSLNYPRLTAPSNLNSQRKMKSKSICSSHASVIYFLITLVIFYILLVIPRIWSPMSDQRDLSVSDSLFVHAI